MNHQGGTMLPLNEPLLVVQGINTNPTISPKIVPQVVAQALPADLLITILGILSRIQTELYAPLVCSHVCAHWRSVTIDTPFLWSYIDTSRGKGLTRLWLSRSKKTRLDVRLWENPLGCDLLQQTFHLPHLNRIPNADSMIEEVKGESYRWRSLDIAFCDMRRIAQTLEFLGETRSNTLHLGSLTIGPMGSTTLVPNEPVGDTNARGGFADNIVARSYLQKLNVTCKVLRIDTYPVCLSPIVFSPQLTSLEVFTGGFYNYALDLEEWAQILSRTPSLVHLRLTSFSHWDVNIAGSIGPSSHPEIELLALESLELSGRFVFLTDLFARSSFPKLEYLLLNSVDGFSVAPRLASIASVSPSIRQLSVSAGVDVWSLAFQHLRLLQEITFFEMSWRSVIAALAIIAELPSLLHTRFERIWDIDLHELGNLTTSSPLLPIELMDCHNGGAEDGSNYSSNSSFYPPHTHGYPPSEETGSDESERSYGVDEDDVTEENVPP